MPVISVIPDLGCDTRIMHFRPTWSTQKTLFLKMEKKKEERRGEDWRGKEGRER